MRARRPAALGIAALTLPLALAPAPATSAVETIEHVVEPGQTLWSISARTDIYADALLWPLIYKWNRDQIQDPARIYPQQRLQIPVYVDPAARAEAYRDARAALRAAGAQDDAAED